MSERKEVRRPPSASNGQSLPEFPSQERDVIVIICAHTPFLSCLPGAGCLGGPPRSFHNSLPVHNSVPLALAHICLSLSALLRGTLCVSGPGTHPGPSGLHPRWRPMSKKCRIGMLTVVCYLLFHLGEPGHPGGPGKDGMNGEKGERGQKLCSILPCSNSEPSVT